MRTPDCVETEIFTISCRDHVVDVGGQRTSHHHEGNDPRIADPRLVEKFSPLLASLLSARTC
jgi:hypothetical protein